jgi:hypothetical protein
MRKILALFFVSFLALGTSNAQEMKLDDVLNSYFKAAGLEKMMSWTSYVATGKSVAGGMEFPFTMIRKRPNKIRIEAEVQGNKMIQAFDGEKGWSVIPWSGSSEPKDMTPDEIKSMKDEAEMEGTLYNWKEKGHQAELIGKEDVEGSSAYKIKLVKSNGNESMYFIDAENFMLIKISAKVKVQGNEIESETYLTDYKDVNGVMTSCSLATKMKGQTISQIVIEKNEVNVPVEDSIFVKPTASK